MFSRRIFLRGEVSNYELSFFDNYRYIRIACFNLVLIVCVFWVVDPFHLSCQIYMYRGIYSIPLFSFDVCRDCNHVPCFILDIGNLHLLFFSFSVLLMVVDFIGLFRETAFCFIDFLYCFLIFNFIDFSFCIYYLLSSPCFGFVLFF